MKKVNYYNELYIYKDLALFIIFLSVIIFLILDNNLDYTIILISAAVIIISLYSSLGGIFLLYKKNKCKAKGASYEGRITGKIGINTLKKGYYYKLRVLYKNGKIITPLIASKYVDNLKSKKCSVYEYNNMVYVDDYQLCNKGEKAVKISILN